MFGRLRDVVIVDVYLRTGKYIAVAQAEQEPGVELYAAVTVLARGVAADIIFVRIIA